MPTEPPPAPVGTSKSLPVKGVASAPLGSLAKTSFDGRAELTTNALYDLHGPRTISLDPMSAKVFAGTRLALLVLLTAWIIASIAAPAFLVLGVPLLSPKGWKKVRGKTTAWLDRVASGAA